MRIAFVNYYSGLAERGGETFVDSLASVLSQNNEVIVFQNGKSGKKEYQVVSENISFNPNHPHAGLSTKNPLKRLFLDYFSIKILLFTLKIIPKIIKIKPEYIYPLNSGWEILLLTIVARLWGIKIIIGGHSGPGWNDRFNLLFHPDIFVALTNTQARWAEKATIWNNQKILVIPNGVNVKSYSPKGGKSALDLDKPIILAVGAATKSKGLENTIRAVSLIKNTSLLLCSSGPEERHLDVLGKSRLGKKYKRIKVSQADMPNIYRSADVFTLCSDNSEAFGIVYLEAMATGLPCVVTDDSSRREILGKDGFYVKDANDSSEYAQKIKEAFMEKSSKRYFKQAQKYSWEKIASSYENILRTL